MPFTAVCPHCRRSTFRAPLSKRGTFVACPKCRRDFLLVPDPADAPPVEYHLGFDPDPEPDEPADPEPVAVGTDLDLSVPAELAADPPPASPAAPDLGADPPRESARPVGPGPAAPGGQSGRPAERVGHPGGHGKEATVMALAALGLVGASVLAAQFPYGRIAGAVLAAAGLALGGLSLLGLDKRPWLGWAGAGLNGLVLLLVVALPGWVGADTWVPVDDPAAGPKPVTAVGRDGAPPQPATWVDAGRAVWEQGDVRAAVTSAAVGPLHQDGPAAKDPAKKKERALRIGVKLTNVGVARAVQFSGWPAAGPDAPQLSTAAGAPVPLKPAGPPPVAALFPGKSAEAVLVFDVPPADDLRLELPAQPFGGPDPVRLLIPRGMVAGLPAAGK